MTLEGNPMVVDYPWADVQPDPADQALYHALKDYVASPETLTTRSQLDRLQALYESSTLALDAVRIVLVLFLPGRPRLLVTRDTSDGSWSFARMFEKLMQKLASGKPISSALAQGAFLQIDVLEFPPAKVKVEDLDISKRGRDHFEPGLDGLMLRRNGEIAALHLPADVYMLPSNLPADVANGLKDSLTSGEGPDPDTFRFRCVSFGVSQKFCGQLYRGIPRRWPIDRDVGSLTRTSLVTFLLGVASKTHDLLASSEDTDLNIRRLEALAPSLLATALEVNMRGVEPQEEQLKVLESHLRLFANNCNDLRADLPGFGMALWTATTLCAQNAGQEFADLQQELQGLGKSALEDYRDAISGAQAADAHRGPPSQGLLQIAVALSISAEQDFPLRESLADFWRISWPLIEAQLENLEPEYSLWATLVLDSLIAKGALSLAPEDRTLSVLADTMREQQYTSRDAPYPDYSGAFYREYGEFSPATGFILWRLSVLHRLAGSRQPALQARMTEMLAWGHFALSRLQVSRSALSPYQVSAEDGAVRGAPGRPGWSLVATIGLLATVSTLALATSEEEDCTRN